MLLINLLLFFPVVLREYMSLLCVRLSMESELLTQVKGKNTDDYFPSRNNFLNESIQKKKEKQ